MLVPLKTRSEYNITGTETFNDPFMLFALAFYMLAHYKISIKYTFNYLEDMVYI